MEQKEEKTITKEKNTPCHNYYIGGAAQTLCCNKSLLRYYENEFALNIPRTQSGRRLYGEEQLELFRYILKLKEDKYSNTQIKKVISERFDNTPVVVEHSETELTERVPSSGTQSAEELKRMIEELRMEVASLKNLSEFKQKEDLIEENKQLKEKLKQKTYELVDARDRLSKVKSKKIFK